MKKIQLIVFFGIKSLVLFQYSQNEFKRVQCVCEKVKKLIFRPHHKLIGMIRILILITLNFGFNCVVYSQNKENNTQNQFADFPMKGDFIYYDFKHTTNNINHDLNFYFVMEQSDFYDNFITKSVNNLSTNAFSKGTQVMVGAPVPGEHGELEIHLPAGVALLDQNLLFALVTWKKFKVKETLVSAKVKLVINNKNSYSLIFTNFLITYYGWEGKNWKSETLDLELVIGELKKNGKMEGKMYDKTNKNMLEIDRIVKSIDELFATELTKAIKMDN